MERNRKVGKDEEKSMEKRTKLPSPVRDLSADTEEPRPNPHVYHFTLDNYLTDCFVEAPLMIEEEACVARGTFRDAHGMEVLVHMPTQFFFKFHALYPNAPHI